MLWLRGHKYVGQAAWNKACPTWSRPLSSAVALNLQAWLRTFSEVKGQIVNTEVLQATVSSILISDAYETSQEGQMWPRGQELTCTPGLFVGGGKCSRAPLFCVRTDSRQNS